MVPINIPGETDDSLVELWRDQTLQMPYFVEQDIYEPRQEKANNVVSEQVRHKPGCKGTEDGWRLEISALGRRGSVLSL